MLEVLRHTQSGPVLVVMHTFIFISKGSKQPVLTKFDFACAANHANSELCLPQLTCVMAPDACN